MTVVQQNQRVDHPAGEPLAANRAQSGADYGDHHEPTGADGAGTTYSAPLQRFPGTVPRIEATAALDWYTAIELPDSSTTLLNPAQRRRAWIHRAPEPRVVRRYLESGGPDAELPAPWWLRALASGALDSRAGGFAVEDAVAELLDSRPGWEYLPWVADGDSGYWEYLPSEVISGHSAVPTTVTLTARHPGWIDVYPAHVDRTPPEPITIHGPADLRSRITEIETLGLSER